MNIIKSSSPADRKKFFLLLLWLVSGVGMIIVGIMALVRRKEAIGAISGFLGVCALITGIITLIVRISQVERLGKRNIGLDIPIWIALGFLLLNTDIFQRLGKLAFIILGVATICEGVRSFFACRKNKEEKAWYIPRVIFSCGIAILGIIVLVNAEIIFTALTSFTVGIFFIVHGTELLYEWIGRAKHFFYFRGTE